VKTAATFSQINERLIRFTSKFLIACFYCATANAQTCPYNIDFETGTFDGWTCYTGFPAAVDGQNVITLSPSGPVRNRHVIYSYAKDAGKVDQYAGFPVVCPNGSNYSIRLGDNTAGTKAQGISYDFTIPDGQNVYSLIYNYAVVFQDPNHRPEEQPRMEIEIKDMTDNIVISCSSFTFIPYGGTLLPGFFESTNPQGDTPVWCKDWSAVSVNLNGLAGKRIRLSFKTADCTFKKHFGYAYIDVNSECGDEFVGAQYCPDDTAVNLTAPFGYQSYTWFNSSFQTVGTQQTIRFSPPPSVGTTLAVKVVPYNGYGCLDTLYAKLVDTLKIIANAGRDTISCNHSPVVIGVNAKPGYIYSWSPVAGLNNPTISNPIAIPDVTTSYIVSTRHDGGGCLSTDTVVVKASIVDSSMTLIGQAMYCLGNNDSTILQVKPTDNIQWYKNNFAINGGDQPQYRVAQSGTYYAQLTNNDGCSIATRKQDVLIDKARPGISYPVQYAIDELPLTLHARDFGTSADWSPPINLDDPSGLNPIYKGNTEQLYTITIRTSTGCVTVDTQLVKTVSHADIYVPTAFTPNGDGLNDILRPTLMGIKELHYFRVYDRWGQLLFETKTNFAGWDGTYNGTRLPTQVVVWIAEGIGVDGNVYSRKGTSTLMR
jgi:gliding motility-associated-like protein